MSPTLACASCGARWHTAARRGRSAATDTCLRCGGALAEVSDQPVHREDGLIAIVDEFCEAWHDGDAERVLAACHPEIEIQEIEALVPGHEARFQGHEGTRKWMELIRELWDVEFRAEPRERRLLDAGSVELRCDLAARSSGADPDFSATTRSLWAFEAGKVRRVEFSVVRAAAADAPRA